MRTPFLRHLILCRCFNARIIMKLNNIIVFGIIVTAYVVSAVRFGLLQMQIRRTRVDRDDAERVLRVTHWQLEPGFREAMQWAIDRYNALPHVQAANVRIEQLAITERVYNQFMNVHLISGTAPDIANRGKTRLVQGNNMARFYTALGEYISDPNPYNQPQYLNPGLPDDLVDFLENAPWQDTFVDGMLGGYDWTLNDYYAIPISGLGSLRLFYNRTLLRDIKAFLAEAVEADPQPDWLRHCWIRKDEGGAEAGFLPDTPSLRAWLEHGEPPETLGQFFLYCEAVQAYAKARAMPFLVPISGSNYDPGNLAFLYKRIFTSHFADDLIEVPGENLRQIEALAGWESGIWSFRSPPFKAFLDFSRIISTYFPRGFLGLDREQAQRRFILGNAAIISSGAWDASGIFLGAQQRDRPEDRFEVIVTPAPMPAADERWQEYLPMNVTEASFVAGTPLAINQQTPHFRWALDFLQFMSSHSINEEFAQRANWLPAIVGAEPSDFMRPFMPIPAGLPPNVSVNLIWVGGGLQNVYTGALKLFMTGDIDADEFIERVERFLRNPRTGMHSRWVRELQWAQDFSRARDRAVGVEEFRMTFREDETAMDRLKSLFHGSLMMDRGVFPLQLWQRHHGDAPYPEF